MSKQTRRCISITEGLYLHIKAHAKLNSRSMSSIVEEVLCDLPPTIPCDDWIEGRADERSERREAARKYPRRAISVSPAVYDALVKIADGRPMSRTLERVVFGRPQVSSGS